MSVQFSQPGPGYFGQGPVQEQFNSGPNSLYNGGGFTFKKRFERLDWKKLSATDVDAISRNLDFNALQDNIMNVTFCNIEAEIDTRLVDPSIIKLFKLAQLIIEYLLHSQDYLTSMIEVMESKFKKSQEEQEETKKDLLSTKDHLVEVKKENHKRKKMLVAQQHIIQSGVNSYNKCQFCQKAFVNASFLQSHIQRRHNQLTGSQTQQQEQQLSSVDVKPVAVEPKIVQVQAHAEDNSRINAQLENEMKEIKERLQMTESQLVEERNARNTMLQREKQDKEKQEKQLQEKMRTWQDDQQQQHKKHITKIQDTMMRELNELNEKYQSSQKMLDSLQRKLAHQSNLGALQDDDDHQKLLEKQREEVAVLREQLEGQMQQKLQEQELRWKTKVEQIEHQQEADAEAEELRMKEEEELRQQLREELEKSMQQQLREKEDEWKTKVEHLEERQQHQPSKNVSMSDEVDNVEAPSTSKVTGVGAMYDDSEDETETTRQKTEADDDQYTEFDGTSTFTTTRGTLSMGQFFAGTLSLTEPLSERLQLELKNNPNILKALRKELLSILDQALKSRGIPPNATGMADAIFENKIQLLRNERQALAKKYHNIYDIRQHYLNTIEQQAKEILKTRESATQPKSRPVAELGPRPTPSAPSEKDIRAPPAPQQKPEKLPSAMKQKMPPVPAPRSTSPAAMGTMSSIGGHTRTSVGSSMLTTASSTWDDETYDDEEDEDDDEDDEDEDETETENDAYNGKPIHHQNVQQRSPAKAITNQPTQRRSIHFEDDVDDEDDSNWDDLSGVDTLEPSLPRKQAKPYVPNPNASKSVPQTKKTKQRIPSIDDDDDSLPTVSSFEDEKPAAVAPPARRSTPQSRNSMIDTDHSTNTLGTSQWGSSKAASTAVRGSMAHNTTAKTSTDSDVWDSDLEDD